MVRRMRWMKGARALASGMLVLALSCAIPAISVAQDAGTTTDATTTTTTTTPTVPADPGPPQTDPSTEGAAAGNPTEPPPIDGRTADSSLGGDRSPADAPSGGGSYRATPKAHKSASASVTMGDLFFSPTSVSIAVGDTVTWNNTGQAPHNASADDGSFKTPTINNGESTSHTFTQAGTFSYICTIHPNMKGTVRVLSSGSDDGGGGGGGGASSGSSSSGNSEASAVASPGAAGDANTLPMTGMGVGGLALVGFGLLALGLIARQADRERSRRRWLPIF
jgi:plastocyanin